MSVLIKDCKLVFCGNIFSVKSVRLKDLFLNKILNNFPLTFYPQNYFERPHLLQETIIYKYRLGSYCEVLKASTLITLGFGSLCLSPLFEGCNCRASIRVDTTCPPPTAIQLNPYMQRENEKINLFKKNICYTKRVVACLCKSRLEQISFIQFSVNFGSLQ